MVAGGAHGWGDTWWLRGTVVRMRSVARGDHDWGNAWWLEGMMTKGMLGGERGL